MKSMLEIAEDKFIKITWRSAAGVVVAIILVAMYIGSIDSKATEAISRQDRQGEAIKDIRKDVGEINNRTIRMETILNEWKRGQ